MMDYEAFGRSFVLVFLAAPFVVGAGAGLIWAWRKGRRGLLLLFPAVIGGAGLCLVVVAAAILFFRA